MWACAMLLAAAPFVSEIDGFSLTFPRQPPDVVTERGDLVAPSAVNATGVNRAYIADDPDGASVGVYLDDAGEAGAAAGATRDFLKRFDTWVLNQRGSAWRLESQRDVKCGEVPGVEVVVRQEKERDVIRGFVVGSHIFRVEGANYGKRCTETLDSFRLLSPSPKR